MREARRSHPPRGTVTLLFTDVEGSTALLTTLGPAEYGRALARHRRLLRDAFREHGGVEVDTQGDSFFVAFPAAAGAVAAAMDVQRALADEPLKVRIGIHTGAPELTDEGYVGVDVHRAARVAAAAHGRQVLLSAATAGLVQDANLADLGLHRLRGIEQPERLFQVGPGSFPPPRTEHQTNLPIPPTPFIGRERELAEVAQMIADPDIRLITLTGPGGTGKTRLALSAATRTLDLFSGGVWWVPLAQLRDAALVIETTGQTVGVGDDVASAISDQRMLLVLDNFEQVLGAAADLARLLGACPNLHMLVTSRAPLRVAAEHEYGVPPLSPGDGLSLFVARARAVVGDAEAMPADTAAATEICRRVDDLPLAIELAAARLRVMSPTQLLSRLDSRLALLTRGSTDQADRHQTLRATIEWSYDLLEQDERGLLARMSVFRGGCDLNALEVICAADLAAVEALVSHSLLRRRGERYTMLETIREFAAERLAESGAASVVAQRHAGFYLSLVEEAEPHLFSFSREWLDRLASEHDNARAALDWLESAGRTQEALRLAGALQRFWIVRGHLAEGRRRLMRLLATDTHPTAARGKALNGAALLALNTGEQVEARALATEARALHEQLEDAWGLARSAFVLGSVEADMADFVMARELFEQSLAGFEALGDEHNVLFVSSNLSWIYRELGDEARARAVDEETLRHARALGNESMVALSLAGVGMTALSDGRPAEAHAMIAEALAIDERQGDVRRSVDDFCRMCRVLAAAGDPAVTTTLLVAAERLHTEIGASVSPGIAELNAETRRALGAVLDPGQQARAEAAGAELTFAEAYALARGASLR